MLPSPGFSIPSIGTPIHQPEEDQQIIANNSYPQYAQQMAPPSMAGGLTPLMGGSSGGGNSGIGSSNSNSGINFQQYMQKMTHSTYQPSYATPPQQTMAQPQTPVSKFGKIHHLA